MENGKIQFIGENLLLGQIGNWALAIAFSSAFLAFLSYTFSTRNTIKGLFDWRRLARLSFIIHSLAVFTIVGTLFYILVNHRFEYHYAWQHTSNALPFKYVFAAFWEGQEGSFLLWTFWLSIISIILMFTSREWEGRVMAIFAIVQMFLISMVLGAVIEIPGVFEYKIGSNPFILTREHPNFIGAPFTQMAGYLKTLDGRGLNPSLQNYWMTIHPPTLFLGFALTLVPYLYCVAGLWSGKLNEWTKPALPWAFTGIAVLGGGILMGGAWAYEALSFGGFWAWDPVENSSLVPWLTLVGAGHLMLVPKNKGINLKAGIVLSLTSFILVLYSTFLTRSGILGDASVHSFTDLGLSGQLLIYLFFFIVLPSFLSLNKVSQRVFFAGILLIAIAIGYQFNILYYAMGFAAFLFLMQPIFIVRKDETYFPPSKKEDNIYSREFWIFVGALVLQASSMHLTFSTSIPVINKIFSTDYAPPKIDDYNMIQTAFAVFITLFMGAVQFLRYKQESADKFWKNIVRSVLVSIGIVVAGYLVFPEFRKVMYILLVFTGVFTIFGNIDFIIKVIKSKWKLYGSALAHIGFGLVIVGAVISAGHKKIISQNFQGIDLKLLNEDFENNENIMLHKHDTLEMGPYYLTYINDTVIGYTARYQINYLVKKNDKFEKAFTLTPTVILNDRMGNVAEPATKHYFNKDIFTHVTYVDLAKTKRKSDPTLSQIQAEKETQHFTITRGDTIFGTRFFIVFEGFEALSDIGDMHDQTNISVTLRGSFLLNDLKGSVDTLRPIYKVEKNMLTVEKDSSDLVGLDIVVEKILDDKFIEVAMRERVDQNENDFIIMQAIIFPGINILWTGCFLMVIGTLLAVFKRIL